jgi:lipopolysaccharide assembly outer membrane protein LptD (OstA)
MINNSNILAVFSIKLIKVYYFIAMIFFIVNFSIAQERDLKEPISIPAEQIIVADSTQMDSLTPDTTVKKEKFKLESKIVYDADIVSLSRSKNKIYLSGNAKVKYENMTLTAAKIVVDQNENFLFAEGIVDTVDSLGNPIYKDTPVFTEQGEEPMYGNTLQYDFKTKRGKIVYGKTQMSPGYYRGQDIYKISEKTLLVSDGYFTSCEYIDNPHFYFRSDKMRVVVKDKVVAKPVYFYIADVPLGVIPFGVFPNKKGRRSGILIPSYGESAYGGRFLKNIGYYWAPNDYIDATFLTK